MTNAVVYRKTAADVLRQPALLVRALVRASPALLKVLALLLFLINIRSWPLVWHINVLVRPVYEIRVRYWARLLPALFKSRTERNRVKMEFMKGLCPVGEDPIRFTVSVKNWAGPDDCDFNWHLSNSSYPKQLDSARFRAALKMCPTFLSAGGWMPLAATHFRFIREIPIFAPYEIRMSIAAWDDKWMYVVIRYVTHPKRNSKKSKHDSKTKKEEGESAGVVPAATALHTPGSPLASGVSTPAIRISNGTSTPSNGLSNGYESANGGGANGFSNGSSSTNGGSSSTNGGSSSSSANMAERIAAQLPAEPDGATLHCVAVCELCCKVGRITVPPAIVIAMEGFVSSSPPPPTSDSASTSTSTQDRPKPYSHTNPPPGFVALQELLAPDFAQGMPPRTLRAFLQGGWRAVPVGQRWWEDALGGDVEARRVANLERVRGVREGMDRVLGVWEV